MLLVEKHIIRRSHSFYNECDSLCFKSKNIYNQGLYNIRQHFFETNNFLNYYDNYHVTTKQECYNELPTKVFCQTLRILNDNFKSFFSLLKNKEIKNRIPNYLDKINGRFITKFPKQALGLKIFKDTGDIHLSKTNIFVKTQIKDFNTIKEVRIIPRNGYYIIEVIYEKKCKENNNIRIAAIDPGLNNLATITFNDGSTPYIINGRPLKSINQYYNKNKSKLESAIEKQYGRKKSKRIERLTNKRNNKINDYLHKSSRILVNQLVKESVGVLVMGKNTGQKQDVNMGKKNNQNFVDAPIFRFLNMIKYKCELEGIRVIQQEESFTSKASFLNLDYIPTYDQNEDESYGFSGYREHRGLYKLKGKKIRINADVNGSYNILRKAIPNIFSIEGIEGFGVIPIRLN